jgi:hypothetical protein
MCWSSDFESGERRWGGVELGAVAKALTVDPVELFTRFVQSQVESTCSLE